MNVARELVRRESEFDKEIQRLRGRILDKERRISETITDFVSLKIRLEDFHEKEYMPAAGVHELELERLRELFFGGRGKAQPGPEKRPSSPAPAKSAEKPAGGGIKKLYKRLAKLYHPDAAPNATDKEFYHARMAAINAAFAEGDEKRLRQYLENADAEIGGEGQTPLARLKALRIDDDVLSEVIVIYTQRLKKLKKTAVYQFMREMSENADRGAAMLEQLAGFFKERIELYRKMTPPVRA